jgi:hypothetical protein
LAQIALLAVDIDLGEDIALRGTVHCLDIVLMGTDQLGIGLKDILLEAVGTDRSHLPEACRFPFLQAEAYNHLREAYTDHYHLVVVA